MAYQAAYIAMVRDPNNWAFHHRFGFDRETGLTGWCADYPESNTNTGYEAADCYNEPPTTTTGGLGNAA